MQHHEQWPTSSAVHMDPKRTPLAQHYGLSPGQPIIQSFGTTATRFQRVPLDGRTDRANPGPGTYEAASVPRGVVHQYSTSWGSEAAVGDRVPPVGDRTPAPGIHGSEVPCDGGMLTQLLRKWPGRTEASTFGTNAAQRGDYAKSETPGAGAYESASAALFAANSLGGAGGGAPFVPEARRALGSRKRISSDTQESSAFASTSRREVSDGSTCSPGPFAYSLVDGFLAQRRDAQRETRLRAPTKGAGPSLRAFATSERRFTRLPLDGNTEPANPGPGAHTVRRWSGEPTQSHRRPQTTPTALDASGFLSSNARFPPGEGQVPIGQTTTPGPGRYPTQELGRHTLGSPSHNSMMPHPSDAARRRRLAREHLEHTRSPAGRQPTRAVRSEAPAGQDVVAYLATGAAGAVGTQLHRQTLMRLLREAAASAELKAG